MSTREKDKNKSKSKLFRLAARYFRKKGYRVERKETEMEGSSGLLRKFDLVVQRGPSPQGVRIKDWNRTIGINVIINLDQASDDAGLSNPIIIGDKFSDHAKSYANRRKIMLLTKRRLAQDLS